MGQEKLLLSIGDVVAATGICRSNIFVLIKAGNLKATRIGRRTFVKPDDLRAFVEAPPRRVTKAAA
jgi:hypothetical protein